MSNRFKGSPYRRRHDLESSGGRSTDLDHDDYESSSPFNISSTKNASIDRLRRWRQAALVLNASRRFRYTLDLKKEEEKKQILRKIRAHAQAIRAAYLFKEAGLRVNVAGDSHQTLSGEFSVTPEQLSTVTRDHNITALQELGGVKGLTEALKTNPEKGIVGDDTDLMKRKNAFGSNTYPQRKGRSFWMFLWDAWQDLTLIILMVAAAASLALGIKTEGIKKGWYDGASIAFAVILVIVVTAISDYRQSLQFQNLNEEKRNIHLEVIRGGRRVDVSIYDIVVGDVIPLNIGDQVPADGVLITGHSLAIDESSMTGESKIVQKSTSEPFLMSGCKVADGSGAMLVTGVGINTEWGLLMASISEDTGEETPLQVRLNGVATFIGIVGLSVAVLVLVVLVIRYFTGHTKNPDGSVQFKAGQTSVSAAVDGAIKIFTVAVTIVVVAVPEGLPLAVTLTLAYSMRKMMRDKALVRRLSACETMGSATTICSDKTGTLTLNEMTVVDVYVGGKKLECPDNKTELSESLCSLLIEGVAQNTNGSVFVPEGGGDVEVSGSPTEKAILVWGVKMGMNFDAVRSESTLIHVFPFNSEKKRGGVALQSSDSQVHIHWKGAAEIVLASCTWYIDQSGDVVPMDEDKASQRVVLELDRATFFKEAIDVMAASSLRCVAIAYRSYEREKVPADEQQLTQWSLPEDDLVLLAIVGLKDPCRPGVRDAVRLCQDAGVKVRMVTGDNLQTAKAIALECGILGSNDDAVEPNLIEGKIFRAYSDEQREEIAEKISVMGRSSPNDKLLLVQALRKRGHVVAVTGDGTNDAPALHEADIGLSMGIQGTEVAKENSDIIILDDNFASVVKVVRWGRSVYANIQKFIQFQLTVNVAALIINVVAAISSGDVPLNAVQLLWVNLIMDTLGALALATEPPTDHLMHRPPVGRREPLITNIMWRNLLIQASYQVIVLLALNFQGKKLLGLQHDNADHANKVKNTLIFNAFVLCQIFNEFNARKPDERNIFRGVTKNRLFIGIVAVTLILQVIIIEFIGKFTSTVKLNWKQWLISVAIGFVSYRSMAYLLRTVSSRAAGAARCRSLGSIPPIGRKEDIDNDPPSPHPLYRSALDSSVAARIMVAGFRLLPSSPGTSRSSVSLVRQMYIATSCSRYLSTAVGGTSDGISSVSDVLLADVSAEVVTPAMSEVSIAAADSFLPVAALQHFIDAIHSYTGLNWWASIVVATLLIRGAMLPIIINQLKATAKLSVLRPHIDEINQRMQDKGMEPTAVADGQKEIKKLFKDNGVHPLTPMKGLFIQAPVFISFFLAISNMAEKVPSFKSGGAYWFLDLTTPDSLYVLPVLTGLTFLVTVECNMQEGLEGNAAAGTMKKISRVIAVATVPLTMSFQKAIFCYWITSNLYSLGYGLVLKVPGVKKTLGIPELPVATASSAATSQSSFDLFSALKRAAAAARVGSGSSPLPPPVAAQPKFAENRLVSSPRSVVSQRVKNLEKQRKRKNNKVR
ncbi:Calcium-transporting ATPase 10, plasma membrane-type [Linum perenne]